MKLEYLKRMDQIARKAGTREPDDILDYMGCVFIDPGVSIDGFVTRRKGIILYGVNQNITGKKCDFAVMHEGFHIVCGHLRLPGFLKGAALTHIDAFGSFADYKWVASTERDADIGAADFICDTQDVLDMMGYDSADVAAFRKSLASFEQHERDYRQHLGIVMNNGSSEKRILRMKAYQNELGRLYEELQEQANDIMNSGICLSKADIARELGVPEYIVDYKMEALALRKYDVETVELPTFDKVFSRWN